jgi:hypothetical protein
MLVTNLELVGVMVWGVVLSGVCLNLDFVYWFHFNKIESLELLK